MKFRPLHDRVVIKRVEQDMKSAGGIIIPDTAQEKPMEGEVLAVGPGGRDEAGKLVPLDVTRQAVLRRPALAGPLARDGSAVARFVADFTLHAFDFAAAGGAEGITLHDPLAVAVALDPSLVDFEPFHVEIECDGRVTRGALVADRRLIPPHRKRPPNSRVAVSVDAPRFLQLFLEHLCPASP